jgi:hypothetical protein
MSVVGQEMIAAAEDRWPSQSVPEDALGQVLPAFSR